MRQKAKEAERTRERQAAAAAQNEAEVRGERRDRAQRKKRQARARRRREGGDREVARRVEARIGERLRSWKRDRKRRTPKGGRRLAHHTPLLKIPVWWRRAVLPSLPWLVRFLSFFFARGELDRLEGPGYAARRAELRRKAKEAERTRERQAAAAAQNEGRGRGERRDRGRSDKGEHDARRGRPRGGTKVEARIGERLRSWGREIGRGGRPRVGRTASWASAPHPSP